MDVVVVGDECSSVLIVWKARMDSAKVFSSHRAASVLIDTPILS